MPPLRRRRPLRPPPDDDRKDVGLLFHPAVGSYRGDYAGSAWGWAEGGDRYGGHLLGDDDCARLRFRVETLAPTPALVTPVPVGPVVLAGG
jgi:hypothetical protein